MNTPFVLTIQAEYDDGSVLSLAGDWRLGTDTGRGMAIARAQAKPCHRRVWLRAIATDTGAHEDLDAKGYEAVRGRDY